MPSAPVFRRGITPDLAPPSLAGPTTFPCYDNTDNGNSSISGCTGYTANSQAAQAWSSCQAAATAPYAGNAQLQGLALASLDNIGCYVTTKGGILTPPAFGTVGNANRNIFRGPSYPTWTSPSLKTGSSRNGSTHNSVRSSSIFSTG